MKSFENSHQLSQFLAVTTAMAEMTSSWTNSAARHAKTVSGEAAPNTQQQLLSSRFGACLKTGHFFVVHLLIMYSCSRNFFEGVMTCTHESHLQDDIFLHCHSWETHGSHPYRCKNIPSNPRDGFVGPVGPELPRPLRRDPFASRALCCNTGSGTNSGHVDPPWC